MMSKNKFPVLFFFLTLFMISVYFSGCSQKKEVQYKTVKPFYGSIQLDISTTGKVSPKNKLSLMPSISGRIDRILVREGQRVYQGQTIAWMSSTERAALIDASRAQGGKMMEYWQKVYASIPIVAPINGTIIARSVEPGQTVTAASTEMFVISDYLIVEADVDETDIGRVRVGQKVSIVLDPYPDITTEGLVNHIAYESTTSNNVTVYIVDIKPVKTPRFFRSGMSASITILEQQKERTLLLTRNALINKNHKYYVFIPSADKKTPRMKEIKTGIMNASHAEVVSGLKEGEKVLIEVQDFSIKKTDQGENPFMPKRPKRDGHSNAKKKNDSIQ